MFLLKKASVVLLVISCAFPLLVKAQNPVPSITLTDTLGCVNVPKILTGFDNPMGSATSWTWTSSPSTNVTFSFPNSPLTDFTAAAAGTYTITLTVAPGGATASVIITVFANPIVTLTPSTYTVCSTGSGVPLSAGGTAGTTYSWAPSTGLSATTGAVVTANPTAPSVITYTVTGTKNGCIATKTSQITALVTTAVTATAVKNTLCIDSTTSLIANAPQALSYSWSPSLLLSCNNCANPVVSAGSLAVLTTTVYKLTVTGDCFSKNWDTVTINSVICKPPVASFSFNHTVCRYECITFSNTSKTLPLTYKWYFQGGSIDSSTAQNPTVCYDIESSNSPNGNGMYYITLIVKDMIGQTDTLRDSIRVKLSPVASINNGLTFETIQVGGHATLNASSYTSGGVLYTWAPAADTCLNAMCGIVTVSPQQDTYYVVTVVNGLGCKDYDTILVKVNKICGEVFIPTAFSPNKDGVNDYAKVLNNDCITSMSFGIFDKWGNQVFSSTDLSSGWNGDFKGSPMDAGVFMYYFSAVLKDKTVINKKGTITLVR